MPVCDMHVHTRISADGDRAAENNALTYCKTAIERGIGHLAFTEHFDIIPDPGAITCDFNESKIAVLEAKEEYGKSLDIMLGVELAHMNRPECHEAGNAVLSEKELDFVLGSFHILSDGTDHCTMNFSEYSDKELTDSLDKYLDELYAIASECDFDSLAHCTYPLRYFHINERLGVVDMNRYKDAYAEMFRTLIMRGKSLEINSSTLRSAYETPLPSYELVDLYLDLGGKNFTLGSDSHRFDLVGTKIDDVQKYLEGKGIEGICTYKKRQQIFVKF